MNLRHSSHHLSAAAKCCWKWTVVSFLCECILTCSTKKKERKKEREKTVRFSSMMLLMMVVLPFNDVMTPLQWDEGLIFVFWANLTSQRDYLSFGRQSPDASHTVSCTTTNQDPVSYEKQGFFLISNWHLCLLTTLWRHYVSQMSFYTRDLTNISYFLLFSCKRLIQYSRHPSGQTGGRNAGVLVYLIIDNIAVSTKGFDSDWLWS